MKYNKIKEMNSALGIDDQEIQKKETEQSKMVEKLEPEEAN